MAVRKKLLGSFPYFSGLSLDELSSFKKFFVEKKVGKGESILVDGEYCDYVYFISSGVVKVYKRSPEGKEQIFDISTMGESLGDVSAFHGEPNQVNMSAITPVSLYAIRKRDLESLIFKYPQVARNALRVMAARLHHDVALVGELSFDKVVNRLAKLILKQAAQEPNSALPRFTQQDLASMVGTNRVVVSRSLRIMEEKGLIRLERRRIVIINEAALKELAGAAPRFDIN